jgi:hypothetical protein
VDVHRHVGDLPLQPLELRERTTELPAGVEVADAGVQRRLRQAGAHRRIAAAFRVELVDQDRGPLLGVDLRPDEHVLRLDPDVLEVDQ